MADGVITIRTRDTNDGTAISAVVGEPLNRTYSGIVQGGQIVFLVPAADFVSILGAKPTGTYTLDDGAGDPDVVVKRLLVNDTDAVDISAGPLLASGSSQAFTISPANAGWLYGFWIGNDPDLADANAAYSDSGGLQSSNVITTGGLPVDGRAMYMRVAIDKQDGTSIEFSMIEITAHTAAASAASALKLTNSTSSSNSNRDLHAYSTVQAFNADETLVNLPRWGGDIYSLDGSLAYADMPYGKLSNATDSFFDVSDPYKLWGTDGNNLSYIDVRDTPPVQTVVYTGPASLLIGGIGSGSSQGSPNKANTKLLVNTSSTLYIIDLTDGSVIRSMARPSGFDWAGMSHSGDYFAVVKKSPNLTSVYSTATGALTGSTADVNHCDFVTDSAGVEYLSFVGSPPKLFRLSNGVTTNQGSTEMYGHMSGRSNDGIMAYSADGTNTVGRLRVGDNFDADFMPFTLLPTTMSGSGGDRITQMRVSQSRTGKYALITIADPVNVGNTYLITWGS